MALTCCKNVFFPSSPLLSVCLSFFCNITRRNILLIIAALRYLAQRPGCPSRTSPFRNFPPIVVIAGALDLSDYLAEAATIINIGPLESDRVKRVKRAGETIAIARVSPWDSRHASLRARRAASAILKGSRRGRTFPAPRRTANDSFLSPSPGVFCSPPRSRFPLPLFPRR